MKKMLFILSYSAGLFFVFQACKKTDTVDSGGGNANSKYINAADCTGSTPTYTANIKSIFDSKCATSGCHVGAGAAQGNVQHVKKSIQCQCFSMCYQSRRGL